MNRTFGAIICWLISFPFLQAQNPEYPEYTEFTGAFDKSPLKEVLNAISASTEVSIYYHTAWTKDVIITASFY